MNRFAGLATLVMLMPAAVHAQGRTTRPAAKPAAAPAAPTRLVLAPTGNEARFIVREQLANVELPNDAVGSTNAISGMITIGADGKVDSANSKITVLMDSLKTDRSNRDRYVKRNTIETAQYPTTVLTVTELRNVPAKLPTSGPMRFTLVGNLTIHGVTVPKTWDVTATADAEGFTGKASTHIKFGEFNMTQPKVMMVMSIVDDIVLEYDFRLLRQ